MGLSAQAARSGVRMDARPISCAVSINERSHFAAVLRRRVPHSRLARKLVDHRALAERLHLGARRAIARASAGSNPQHVPMSISTSTAAIFRIEERTLLIASRYCVPRSRAARIWIIWAPIMRYMRRRQSNCTTRRELFRSPHEGSCLCSAGSMALEQRCFASRHPAGVGRRIAACTRG